MAADYSEALERQAELARRMAVNEARLTRVLDQMQSGDPAVWQRWLDRNPDLLNMRAEEAAQLGLEFGQMRPAVSSALHVLQFGPTYACTPQIASWLETAARSIPEDFSLEPSDPPTEEGFFWTAAPCTAKPPCIHAYSWRVRDDSVDGAVFGHLAKGKPLTPLFVCPWAFGTTLSDCLHRKAFEVDPAVAAAFTEGNPRLLQLSERIARFWAATFVFLHQRVFIATPRAIDRHTRHRLERLGASYEPSVRVVHLRRKIDDSSDESYGDSVHEWHWQWLVRGHWRNQYFPSMARNRPVFVQPYVKGPKDKPLKPMAPMTVYSVDR